MNLKESGEQCVIGFGGRKGKGEMLEINYNLKN